MASKLIGGEAAAKVQRLIFRDVHGGGGGAAGPSGHGFADAPPDSELAQVVASQQKRIRELETELEQRPRQAYEKGLKEGQGAAAQQFAARLDPALAKMAESLRELAVLRKQYLQEAEADAVKLAVAVAKKVLRRELSVDPDAILGVVKAALERVDVRDTHRVRLNPEDRPAVQKHLARSGLPPQVELSDDPSLERGSVIIETGRGNLDASVCSQLKEIERGLVDLVRRSPA